MHFAIKESLMIELARPLVQVLGSTTWLALTCHQGLTFPELALTSPVLGLSGPVLGLSGLVLALTCLDLTFLQLALIFQWRQATV